jgi:hypothetical protein
VSGEQLAERVRLRPETPKTFPWPFQGIERCSAGHSSAPAHYLGGNRRAATPLATLVMGSAPPEHVGSVSGVLATAQNIGSAIGVAAIGAIFYSALHDGYPVAFERGVGTLAVVLLVVAALTRLLPARVR